ncbi:MAG: AAA family ATPase [Lachnospiraceae bacterium]|nr:AAA family ATPase [Lachnospiraceae bacterium]
MANVIAIAGKGGVGKTTLAGLLIQMMCQMGKRPILAVDADANSNLNEVLGVEVEMTLGDVRETVLHDSDKLNKSIPSGMTKADYTEMMLQRCLAEDDDFDLLVMGRSQGQGCYCYVNGLLQAQLAKLVPNYKYVVVDNEAGMEHISRGILPKVDTMLLVSDCSRRGVQATERIAELIKECNLNPKMIGLIVNRAPNGQLNAGTKEEIEKSGLNLLGVVPQDEQVYEYDCDGKPTSSLPEDSPVRQALKEIMKKIDLGAM